MEKRALQNTPKLQIFDQILNLERKTVNSNIKSGFDFLYQRKVKRNIKDFVLSGEWMK